MKELIYYTSVVLTLMAFLMGVDNYFGEHVKWFSIVLFFPWAFQVIYHHNVNWEKLKGIFKAIFGLENKKEIIREEH
jgi:heme/copper-type cytochrome/quinol oxidase subunit 4